MSSNLFYLTKKCVAHWRPEATAGRSAVGEQDNNAFLGLGAISADDSLKIIVERGSDLIPTISLQHPIRFGDPAGVKAKGRNVSVTWDASCIDSLTITREFDRHALVFNTWAAPKAKASVMRVSFLIDGPGKLTGLDPSAKPRSEGDRDALEALVDLQSRRQFCCYLTDDSKVARYLDRLDELCNRLGVSDQRNDDLERAGLDFFRKSRSVIDTLDDNNKEQVKEPAPRAQDPSPPTDPHQQPASPPQSPSGSRKRRSPATDDDDNGTTGHRTKRHSPSPPPQHQPAPQLPEVPPFPPGHLSFPDVPTAPLPAPPARRPRTGSVHPYAAHMVSPFLPVINRDAIEELKRRAVDKLELLRFCFPKTFKPTDLLCALFETDFMVCAETGDEPGFWQSFGNFVRYCRLKEQDQGLDIARD